MKKILLWVGINIVVLAAVLYSIGFVLPRTYYVERSVVINAPPDAIRSHINNLREWPTWTAWTTERYPGMTIKFGEKDSGAGAEYSWVIPNQGVGTLKLTSNHPQYGIGYALNFDQGKYLSAGSFQFKPAENGTKVIWSNEGELGSSPIDRYFGLMMDSMMGPDFETGLAKLKQIVEANPAPPAAEGQAGGPGGRGRKGKGKARTEELPAESVPSEATTSEATPTNEAPTENAPTEKVQPEKEPTDKTPTDKPPTDKPPTDKPPTETAPEEKLPAETAPMDKAQADKEVPVP